MLSPKRASFSVRSSARPAAARAQRADPRGRRCGSADVPGDGLAGHAEPGLDVAELAVAVRGLVEVHEVHVDRRPTAAPRWPACAGAAAACAARPGRRSTSSPARTCASRRSPRRTPGRRWPSEHNRRIGRASVSTGFHTTRPGCRRRRRAPRRSAATAPRPGRASPAPYRSWLPVRNQTSAASGGLMPGVRDGVPWLVRLGAATAVGSGRTGPRPDGAHGCDGVAPRPKWSCSCAVLGVERVVGVGRGSGPAGRRRGPGCPSRPRRRGCRGRRPAATAAWIAEPSAGPCSEPIDADRAAQHVGVDLHEERVLQQAARRDELGRPARRPSRTSRRWSRVPNAVASISAR